MGCKLQVPRKETAEERSASRQQKDRRPLWHTTTTNMGQTLPKLSRSQIRHFQRHVSFTESEIQDWYQEFCRSADRSLHHLCLSEDEFVKVYNSVYPGESDEFARHIFRTFDLNGDHRVDFQEFLIGLSCNGSEDMQKRVSWAFRVYDIRRCGFISLQGMTEVVRAVFKMFGPQTLRYNNVMMSAESLAEELFRQLDEDCDGRISWQEFRKGVTRNPMALTLLQCSPPESSQDLSTMDDDVFQR